jgi:WD40 repeat protein
MSAIPSRLARTGLGAIALFAMACSAPPAPPATPAAPAGDGPVPLTTTTKVAAGMTSLERQNGASAVIVGMADGHVGTWNGQDAALGVTVKPHTARVLAVGSSADGREAWSVAADGTLARTLLTAGAASTTQKIDLGSASTRAAAFSADGSLLVTGGEFGDIRVFDTASGALRHVLRGHRTEIQAIAVRPGSATIASASAESDLRIWDAAAGKEIRFIESDLSLFALGFSPRGDVLASGGVDRRLTLRDSSTFATTGDLALQAPRMVGSLAWSPDGRFIAVGDVDDETLSKGGVDIVDATTRAVAARLDAGGMPAMNLAVLPTGVVVAANGPTLRSWHVPALTSSQTR